MEATEQEIQEALDDEEEISLEVWISAPTASTT